MYPKDCAGARTEGVAGTAQSTYDRCNVCITPGLNEDKKDACVDCADVPFGISRRDKCGICDTDKSNDCQVSLGAGANSRLDAVNHFYRQPYFTRGSFLI